MSQKSKRSIIHFNSGEWSPKVDSRVDHEKYPAACRQLQNMIPMPHGPVTRRKGLVYIAETKNSGVANLVRFQVSRNDSMCLEFGDEYIRFFKNSEAVLSGGSPYEIVSPFTVDEVFDIKFAQINDVLFIAHENHPPQILSRFADDNWTIADITWDYPALLDENVEQSKTLALSAVSGTGVTMTASGHTPFTADHVGSYWRLGHFNTESLEVRLGSTFLANDATDGIFVIGGFTVETTGRWGGQFDLERDDNSGFTSPTTIRTFDSNKDKNYNVEYEAPDGGAWYRLKNNGSTQTGGGDRDDRARLTLNDPIRQSIVKVTGYTSSASVTVSVLIDALSTDATEIWNEGAWSAERGYPRAVSFFENRLLYGGTAYQPQTVWGSVTDDYYDFEQGDEDTDAYAFTLASPERNEIIWLGATQKLLIGTSGGEWLASGNDVDTSITPTSIVVRQHSSNGVDQMRPQLMEGRLVYMQRGGRKLRGMVYDGAEERFKGEDLTVLSDHLTAGRVISMAYQAERDSILWAVTGNGVLIGMTYEPDQGVVGWHRHTTPGNFEAVETIYGTGDDETWVVVKRNIDGVNKRYIEKFSGYYNPTVDGEVERDIQIALVLDTSGSMSSKYPILTAQIETLVNDMETRYDSVSFALVTFETNATVIEDFTDAATIIAAVNGISSGGGNEAGYDAIKLAAEALSWNSGVNDDNVVMIATDEGNTSGTATQTQVETALQNIEARLVYADVDATNQSDYNNVIATVGGYRIADVTDLADDFANNVPLYGYSAKLVEEIFVDSSVTQESSPTTTMTGLDHLNGMTVQVLADGARVPDQVAASGQITIPQAASVIHAGLQYESILQPMRLDVDSQFGVTQGIEKRAYEAILRLMDTGSVRIKTDETAEYDYVRDVSENPGYGEDVEIFTGETKALVLTTRHGTDPTFILSCNDPLPFTLNAVILKYIITGRD